MQVLLPPKRIHLQPIEVEHNDHAKATRDKGVEVDHDKPETEAKKLKKLSPAEPQPEYKKSVETKNLKGKIDKLILPEQVKESNQNNLFFIKIREYLANLVDQNKPTVYLCGNRAINSLLYKDNKLWVANDLRLDVM